MKNLYIIQSNINDISFENRIKSLGSWFKYFSDNWIVESNLTAQAIYDNISVGYETESILITEMKPTNYWGRMNADLWDFIKARKK